MTFLDQEKNIKTDSYDKSGQIRKAKSTAKYYLVRQKDLPLSCPMRGQEVWNLHPKVYLPIEENGGEINCPYCSTGYFVEK